jgi:hypothetical protein
VETSSSCERPLHAAVTCMVGSVVGASCDGRRTGSKAGKRILISG